MNKKTIIQEDYEQEHKYKSGDKVYYVYNNKVYSGKISLLTILNGENCYNISPCVIHMMDVPEEVVFINKQDAINYCCKRNNIIKKLRNKIIKFLKDNNVYYDELDNVYTNEITIDLVKCADILADEGWKE